MKRNSYFYGFLLFMIAIMGFSHFPVQVQATESQPVLLVYDSKNIPAHGDLNIDRCQRLLTSLGLRVKTVQLSQYHRQTLKKDQFQGVITMVNWEQSKIKNTVFESDRSRFKGVKLHIGPNLQADEREELGGNFKTLTHQQLKLHQGRAEQPFSENKRLLVNDKRADNALSVGWLTRQDQPSSAYSYGVKVGQAGFLPALGLDGLAMTLAGQLVSKLFKIPVRPQPPMLTITGITPYTKLERLRQLIDQLSSRGYPFALSVMSVERNTDLTAFHQYTQVLRAAEKAGGIIFWRPSIETGTQRLNEAALRSVFQTELASLGADRVIPVGISAPGYWNRSSRRQAAILEQASHVLMLPDQPQRLEAQPAEPEPAVTTGQQYDTGIVGIPFKAFETVAFRKAIKFVQPTALVMNMPDDPKELHQMMQQLQHSELNWFDPVQNHLETALKLGAALYEYRSGQYQLNGEPITDLDAGTRAFASSQQPVTKTSWMNQIIQWQSQALLWLFTGIGVLLAGLLLIGRRIYRDKFIRTRWDKDR